MKETAKWTNCPLTGEPFICLLFCTLSFVYLSSSLCTLETLCFARVQSSLWFAISAAMQNMNIVQSGQSRFSIIHPPETLLGNWTGATFGGPCSSKSVSNKAAPPVHHLHHHYHTAIIGKVTNNKTHTQQMMKGDEKKWTQLKEQCNEGRERGRTMAEHDYCCWQGHHPPDTHALTHSPQHEKGLSVSVQRENEETMSWEGHLPRQNSKDSTGWASQTHRHCPRVACLLEKKRGNQKSLNKLPSTTREMLRRRDLPQSN